MKVLFLLPPSEGKKDESYYLNEYLTFILDKPIDIAVNATQKDLKCSGERYNEGINLNKNIEKQKTIDAIKRYSGVMYNAIDYENMTKSGKKFFDENFLILSAMYGIVSPSDHIGNYKLPIETKGLYQYWWDIIPREIANLKVDYIINLLPISYAKLIGLGTNCNRHKKKLDPIIESGSRVVNINFLKPDGKKISHGVKKIKGEWLKNICENKIVDYKKFGGEVVENGSIIDVNIVVK